jgi:hypothetical protein
LWYEISGQQAQRLPYLEWFDRFSTLANRRSAMNGLPIQPGVTLQA